VDETATKAAGAVRGQRPGTVRAERLLRGAEGAAYWLVVAPLASRLPASLAYRIACWRGDWTSRYRAAKRSEIVRNLCQVLGEQLSTEEAERLAREFFRMRSCEVIDVMLLRGRARSLGKLVEIRGREHLDAALAAGQGAMLCSAHFGSHTSAFSLLHVGGFPLTSIGRRWPGNRANDMSSAERWFLELAYTRRVRPYHQRPLIEPQPGRVQVAAQAAIALRANEGVTISSDAPPLEADRTRAVDVTFLGRQARLLPGVVTLARLTGAPVLMVFMHRRADYRHQVLEISPPVPMEGETVTAFGRCVAAMDAAIRKNPAHWVYWANTDDLASLGLLPTARVAGTDTDGTQPADHGPAALLEDRRLASDHSGDVRVLQQPSIRAATSPLPPETPCARPDQPGPPRSPARWSSGTHPPAGCQACPRAR
jgi:Kdo2-lipid IVA lauroyltransferase/acyltransferase